MPKVLDAAGIRTAIGDAKAAEPEPERVKGGKPSQADTLIKLARSRSRLFHDGDTAYAILRLKPHNEVWALQSKSFRDWLFKIYFEQEDRAPSSEAVRAAINTLASFARFGPKGQPAEEHKVSVRLAESGGKIYLDLADEHWRAVEIDGDGWRLLDDPAAHGIYFRRPRGMLPLPVPEPGGSISDLRKFVNVGSDRDFVLLVAWIIAAYRPRGPYPILVLNGEQGSAKTGTSRFLRALVDPNVSSARAEPKDVGDLMIAAVNGWIVLLDNLSHLPPWLSDALCRLSTGGGLSKRELYSDMDEVLLDAMRPAIVNGIEELATRSDLLDRAIANTLPTIPDNNRRPEDELNLEFVEMHPSLLGALLDGVSCALRNVGSVKLAGYPRMADFAKWIVAAEPALPWASGEFLEAYQKNRDSANVVSLEASPIYGPLVAIDFSFEDTASELLSRLQAKLADPKKEPKGWPANARSLSNALRRIAPNLRRDGIEVTFHDRSRPRKITIARSAQARNFASGPSGATKRGGRAHDSRRSCRNRRKFPRLHRPRAVLMDARELILALERRGLRLYPESDRLIVESAHLLTDADRAAIRAHKSELLTLLASTAGGSPNVREIGATLSAASLTRRSPEHACPDASFDDSRPLERYPRDWRAPMVLRPCSCGSRWWWLSSHGAIKCCTCNPPADLSLAEAWVLAREPDGRVPGEILAALHVASPPQ